MEVSEWIALASAIAFIVTAAAACLSYAKSPFAGITCGDAGQRRNGWGNDGAGDALLGYGAYDGFKGVRILGDGV